MSFGASIRNGVAIGLRTVATLSSKVASVIPPIVGSFLTTESSVILATEAGDQILVEPVV